MKFGRRLLEESDPRYRHFYISYKNLKQAIILITGSDASNAFSISQVTHNFGNVPALAGSVFRPPESRFQDLLNHEKEKINKFMEVSLAAVVSALRQLLKDLLREDPADEGFYEDHALPLRDIDREAEMLMFLKGYQALNLLGFRKITKKYDKHNKSKSSHWFLAQLQRESFLNADFDTPLKLLSLCYQIVLARQNASGGFGKESLLMSGSINLYSAGRAAGAAAAPLVSAHYLLKPEDAMRVKVLLAKCLPLVSVGTCCFVGREAVDVLINPLAALPSLAASVKKPARRAAAEDAKYSHGALYFDSRQFAAVKAVLNGKPIGSGVDHLLRVRWFGVHDGEPDKDVYLERLPLDNLRAGLSPESVDLISEDFTLSPRRAVVMLKTKHLNAMLTKSFDVENWIRRKCVDAELLDMVRGLLSELQDQLSGGDLLRVIQVWSYRTCFSLTQEDEGVIVEGVLDENLASSSLLHIEDNALVLPTSPGEQCILPFTQVRAENAVIEEQFITLTLTHPEGFVFPYLLNQPRLDDSKSGDASAPAGTVSAEEPSEHTSFFELDIKEMSMDSFKSVLNSVISMHEAPYFSQFAHAAAVLFGSLKHIRLQRPAWFTSTLVARRSDDSDDEDQVEPSYNSAGVSKVPLYSSNRRTSTRFLAEEMIAVPVHGVAVSGGGASVEHQPASMELLPAPKFLDQPVGEQRGFLGLDATAIPIQEESREQQNALAQPLLGPMPAAPTLTQKIRTWWRSVRPPQVLSPPPPTGSASVRVEPKTFFANERTLLQWMNIAVLISTISITLMTVGTPSARGAGFLLAPIAIYFIVHSYTVYIRRTRALLNKEPIDYVDHTGPVVLVLSLVFALTAVVLINVKKALEEPTIVRAVEQPK